MALNTIFLIVAAIVVALVLMKITRKLIHTIFFITLVGVVFFVFKYLMG